MANIKSAAKRYRQSEVRRARNRSHRSAMRTVIKKFNAQVEAGNKEEAQQALTDALSRIDRTGKLRVIHRNTADRLKSRLTLRFNKAFN